MAEQSKDYIPQRFIGVDELFLEAEKAFKYGINADMPITISNSEASPEVRKLVDDLNSSFAAYKASVDYDIMKYKLANQALNLGLWDMDVVAGDPVNPENTFTWSNEFRHMVGYTDVSDFPNKLSSWSDRLHPEDKDRTLRQFADHINDHTGMTPYDLEYRLKMKSGEYRYFRALGTTMRDSYGIPIKVAGTLLDIHDEKIEKEAQAKLVGFDSLLSELEILYHNVDSRNDLTFDYDMSHLSPELRLVMSRVADIIGSFRTHADYQLTKFNLVMQSSNVGLWDMDVVANDPVNPDNSFRWSDEFRRLLGYTDTNDFPDKLSSWSDKLHPDDKERTLNQFAAHLTDRTGMTPYDLEYRLLTKSGEYRYFRAYGSTVRDGQGYAIRVAGAIADITLQKLAAQHTEAEIEREKEANHAKTMFLANMSHEIRTPMNGIIGMTDLLINENLVPRQLQYVKDIKMSAESLLGIINDILDMSKIAEGKLQVVPVDTDLNALLKNIVSMMSFSAHTKGVDFIDDVHIVHPEFVFADDVRIKQILVNLLSNAIKFTKIGSVTLSAKIEDELIKFRVKDTGIGIKPEDIPHIFNAFEQADLHKNRAIKGTGLGLSITKSLVALMGGKLWAESVYGSGTTFFVELPYVRGNEVENPNGDGGFKYLFAPTAQILLVDDIQTNLTVCSGLLRLCGITADVATSGLEAIELAGTRDYDIIFMDHMMPEMDGVEAMSKIRAMGEKYRKMPIIALTANAINESRAMLLTSGMSDFLSKPIDKSELMAILRKWLPEGRIDPGARAATETEAPYSDFLSKAASIEGLDIKLALSRMGGLQDVLETSLRQIMNSVGSSLKKMDFSLSNEDLRVFATEAHGLKSALAYVGATNNSELAAELEIAAKAENLPLCRNKFPAFADVLQGFGSRLKDIFGTPLKHDKPRGEHEFLSQMLGKAIEFLDEFEDDGAASCLEQLGQYSFGDEIDLMLENSVCLLQAFDHEGATGTLQEILRKA